MTKDRENDVMTAEMVGGTNDALTEVEHEKDDPKDAEVEP